MYFMDFRINYYSKEIFYHRFKVVYLIFFKAHFVYLSKERRFFCKFLFLPTRVKKWNGKADLSIRTSTWFWVFYILFLYHRALFKFLF